MMWLWLAAAALYVVIWVAFARYLFMTEEHPQYQWEHRDFRFEVFVRCILQAFPWPLWIFYLAVTYRRKDR